MDPIVSSRPFSRYCWHSLSEREWSFCSLRALPELVWSLANGFFPWRMCQLSSGVGNKLFAQWVKPATSLSRILTRFLLGTIYRPPSAAPSTPSRHQSVAPRATSRRPSSSGSVSGSRFERGGVFLLGGFDYNNADDLFAAGRVLDEVRGQIFERERRARGGGTLSPVGNEYVIGSLDKQAVEGGDDEEDETVSIA